MNRRTSLILLHLFVQVSILLSMEKNPFNRGRHDEAVMEQWLTIEAPDWLEETPLMHAATKGDLSTVSTLLKEAATYRTLNKKAGVFGMTALMNAASKGHAVVVKALLDEGARVNETDNNKRTALILATYFNHPEVVSTLLENKNQKHPEALIDPLYVNQVERALECARRDKRTQIATMLEEALPRTTWLQRCRAFLISNNIINPTGFP